MSNLPSMVSGDTKAFPLNITDADGDSVTVTGATITFRLNDGDSRSDSAAATKTVGDGIAIADGTTYASYVAGAGTTTDSLVTVTLAPSDTASLTSGNYYWELQIVDGSSNTSTNNGWIYIEADAIT